MPLKNDLTNNGEKTKAFLALVDPLTKTFILEAVASHYKSTIETAYQEVTHSEAEHLLDYLTEPTRSTVFILMKRYCLR